MSDHKKLIEELRGEAALIDAGMNIDDGQTIDFLTQAATALEGLVGEREQARAFAACETDAVGHYKAVARDYLARATAAEASLKEAQAIIDGVREDLHSQRSADWYPEGAQDAASSMSESMRLIGNRLADVNLLAQALSPPDTAASETLRKSDFCARGDRCVCNDPSPSRCNAFLDASKPPKRPWDRDPDTAATVSSRFQVTPVPKDHA